MPDLKSFVLLWFFPTFSQVKNLQGAVMAWVFFLLCFLLFLGRKRKKNWEKFLTFSGEPFHLIYEYNHDSERQGAYAF